MTLGPVQYVAFSFAAGTEFDGAIVDELNRLSDRGLVRILDLELIRRTEDGELVSLRAAGLTISDLAQMGDGVRRLLGIAAEHDVLLEALQLVQPGLIDEVETGFLQKDIARFSEELSPGEAVAVILVEHTWATRFAALVRDVGGQPLAQGFITPELRAIHGEELAAISEAAAATELAAAVRGAAYLDALRSLSDLYHLKSAIAAETVRLLMAEQLLEDAAAATAIDILYEAGLIDESALAEADAAVLQAEAELEAAFDDLAEDEAA